MIGKLTGTLSGKASDGAIIIDVGGVGYAVKVSESTMAKFLTGDFAKNNAEKIELFIHTAVREDAIDLYGFPTEAELSFFKLLTGVSGVGPKTALGVLNVADVSELRRAVARGDASMLAKVYGIGKKSAERIVVDLRDKLAKELLATGASASSSSSGDNDVFEALEALGYSAPEIRRALGAIENTKEESVEKRLGAALKELGGAQVKRA